MLGKFYSNLNTTFISFFSNFRYNSRIFLCTLQSLVLNKSGLPKALNIQLQENIYSVEEINNICIQIQTKLDKYLQNFHTEVDSQDLFEMKDDKLN